jgi:phosphatidate cytidylyltransferase
MTSGLALGVAVAIFAPLGDLAMSAAKRSLGLKDMGSVLPGHGGFLDRIDGLLFVIPVAWAIFVWAGIL